MKPSRFWMLLSARVHIDSPKRGCRRGGSGEGHGGIGARPAHRWSFAVSRQNKRPLPYASSMCTCPAMSVVGPGMASDLPSLMGNGGEPSRCHVGRPRATLLEQRAAMEMGVGRRKSYGQGDRGLANRAALGQGLAKLVAFVCLPFIVLYQMISANAEAFWRLALIIAGFVAVGVASKYVLNRIGYLETKKVASASHPRK